MKQNKFFYGLLALIVIVFVWTIAPKNDESGSTRQPDVSNFDFTVYSKGNPNAPVKVVQYSDFLCPSCGQISLSVIPEIEKNYIDTGKVYYTFKLLNLGFNPTYSQKLAEASVCAADQGKFWEYHDAAYTYVYSNFLSKGVDPHYITFKDETPKQLGEQSGIDMASFGTCVDNHDKKQVVIDLSSAAKNAGVTGTPYFTINDTNLGGSVPDYTMLEKAIKAHL